MSGQDEFSDLPLAVHNRLVDAPSFVYDCSAVIDIQLTGV